MKSGTSPDPSARLNLRRIRFLVVLFIAGLILSGVTAFPLAKEMSVLISLRNLDTASAAATASGLDFWLLTVRNGLQDVYAKYPWIAYGTDWLAFAHIIIALFFVGVWKDPVRNVWLLRAGLISCALVVPLALICGPIRGIPLPWRIIDCSFGVFGSIPLFECLRLVRKMEKAGTQNGGS